MLAVVTLALAVDTSVFCWPRCLLLVPAGDAGRIVFCLVQNFRTDPLVSSSIDDAYETQVFQLCSFIDKTFFLVPGVYALVSGASRWAASSDNM